MDLTAQEEAVALLKLKRAESYSDQDLAEKVGKSRNYVTEILGIAGLPGDVLKECLNAGINNKNLMIQVVQAYKRGEYKAFLNQFKAGQIQTVKEAKEFNRPAGHTALRKPASTPGPTAGGTRIQVEKNTIKIHFSSEEAQKKQSAAFYHAKGETCRESPSLRTCREWTPFFRGQAPHSPNSVCNTKG